MVCSTSFSLLCTWFYSNENLDDRLHLMCYFTGDGGGSPHVNIKLNLHLNTAKSVQTLTLQTDSGPVKFPAVSMAVMPPEGKV